MVFSLTPGNRLTKPDVSKTSLGDGVNGGSVDPHCGDEGLIFTVLVELYSWCFNTRVGAQIFLSQVVSVRMLVLH